MFHERQHGTLPVGIVEESIAPSVSRPAGRFASCIVLLHGDQNPRWTQKQGIPPCVLLTAFGSDYCVARYIIAASCHKGCLITTQWYRCPTTRPAAVEVEVA